MYIRLFDSLENNNVFEKEQYRFRAGKSVTTTGVDLVVMILNSTDKGDNVVGVFIDLGKAFDSKWHSKLILILYSMGIQDLPISWCESYLEYISQREK